MAGVGRNERCVCGSGRKTKRCCGVRTGPSETQLARVALARHAQGVAPLLVAWDEQEFAYALDELVELPARYLSLLVPLPRLRSPAMSRLCAAVDGEDVDAVTAALPEAVAEVDTPLVRLRLVEAALTLAGCAELDGDVAAVAVIELASDSVMLLSASLVQAAAVAVGAARTPSGLLVAG
jgi:hypothetical protein